MVHENSNLSLPCDLVEGAQQVKQGDTISRLHDPPNSMPIGFHILILAFQG
jgi:hypothetical protein